MKIALCVEKSGGMIFNNRRLSRDSAVIKKILELSGDKKIYLNSYSASLFDDKEKLFIDDNFLLAAGNDDVCFVENQPVFAENANEIYLFNWNRAYPAEFYFNEDLKLLGFKRIKKEEFEGSSHKKITLEIYKKEG